MTSPGETKSVRVRIGHEHADAHEVSPKQLIERQQRQRAAERRTLTAELLGDPAPGFSALDARHVTPATPTLSSGGGSARAGEGTKRQRNKATIRGHV